MKTNMRNRGIYPVIPNLGTLWKLVVNFMLWLLYSWGKNLHPTMNRRLVGLTHSLGIRVWGKKILRQPGIESQTIQDMG